MQHCGENWPLASCLCTSSTRSTMILGCSFDLAGQFRHASTGKVNLPGHMCSTMCDINMNEQFSAMVISNAQLQNMPDANVFCHQRQWEKEGTILRDMKHITAFHMPNHHARQQAIILHHFEEAQLHSSPCRWGQYLPIPLICGRSSLPARTLPERSASRASWGKIRVWWRFCTMMYVRRGS